jgi:hypothetical protein
MWSSLEIAKLLVAGLTPLFILVLGIWVNRIAKRVEAAQWANQKLIEKRIAIYDQLAPQLNDLYCYYMCVGNWKELIPTNVVDIKRKLDKTVYVYSYLFSPQFRELYNELIGLCFTTFTGQGHNAKLRTPIDHPAGGDRRKSSSIPWQSEWDELFSNEKECAPLTEIQTAYLNLMSCFSEELGVGITHARKSSNED